MMVRSRSPASALGPRQVVEDLGNWMDTLHNDLKEISLNPDQAAYLNK